MKVNNRYIENNDVSEPLTTEPTRWPCKWHPKGEGLPLRHQPPLSLVRN